MRRGQRIAEELYVPGDPDEDEVVLGEEECVALGPMTTPDPVHLYNPSEEMELNQMVAKELLSIVQMLK